MNLERLEELTACCGFQDKIIVHTTFRSKGITHRAQIGMIPVWTMDNFGAVKAAAERIAKGHDGHISYSLHLPMRRQFSKEARRIQIVSAAVNIAAEHGVGAVNQNTVAARVKCSPSLVRRYYNAEHLLNAVMAEAVDQKILSIIAYGVTTQHPVITESDIDLKVEALNDAIK